MADFDLIYDGFRVTNTFLILITCWLLARLTVRRMRQQSRDLSRPVTKETDFPNLLFRFGLVYFFLVTGYANIEAVILDVPAGPRVFAIGSGLLLVTIAIAMIERQER